MTGWVFLGALFFLVGLREVWKGYQYRLTQKQAERWPTADGRILESRVVRNERGVWTSQIVYAYWVDSSEYQSEIVSAGGELNVGFTDRFARRLAERYPEGASVVVHYDRDDPESAFLEAKTARVSRGYLIIGGVFILAGLVLLITWFKAL